MGKLFYASAKIYSSENLCVDAIINPLSWLLGAKLEHPVKVPKEGTKRVSTEGDTAICMMPKDHSHGLKMSPVCIGMVGSKAPYPYMLSKACLSLSHKDVSYISKFSRLLTFC